MSLIKETVVNELHKPARKNYRRRRVIIKGLNDLWQADLVEMQPYAKTNRNHRYILVVINAFSKFVWALPVKSKTGKNVTATMEKILNDAKTPPRNLQTDAGKEFYNKLFQSLMKEFKINHYSSFSNMKASIVERVNRTLKNNMWKKFSMQGSYKWLNILPEIVSDYNNRKHSTTGLKPIDINKSNEKSVLKSAYTNIKTVDPKASKFKKGDFVRISKYRDLFSKGYRPSWSNEIFQIRDIKLTNPRTYLLKDSNNEDILGGFYTEELQKVSYNDIYLVERILRRKGNRAYVKFLGLNNTHNSWVLNSELL